MKKRVSLSYELEDTDDPTIVTHENIDGSVSLSLPGEEGFRIGMSPKMAGIMGAELTAASVYMEGLAEKKEADEILSDT